LAVLLFTDKIAPYYHMYELARRISTYFTVMGQLADKAVNGHGEKVGFVFEVAGMILVALLVFFLWGGFQDFRKVTPLSFTYALIMGVMTSAAAFTLLYALRIAPSSNHVPKNYRPHS